MPAPIVAAGITAAAGLGGAALANRSQGKAADAQARANADALNFEKDKESRRRLEYDQAMQEYRQRYAQWQQQRAGLLSRYGVRPQQRLSLASFGRQPSPMTPMRPTSRPRSLADMGGY